MCRILVYCCGNVNHVSTTEDGDTVISCRYSKHWTEVITEELASETIISHAQFPQIHKLVFIQNTVKDEPQDHDVCNPEVLAPMELIEPVKIEDTFDTFIAKEEPEEPPLEDILQDEPQQESQGDKMVEKSIPEKTLRRNDSESSHSWSRSSLSTESSDKSSDSYKYVKPRVSKRKKRSQRKAPNVIDKDKLMEKLRYQVDEGTRKSFKCKLCRRSYDRYSKLTKHIKIHEKSDEIDEIESVSSASSVSSELSDTILPKCTKIEEISSESSVAAKLPEIPLPQSKEKFKNKTKSFKCSRCSESYDQFNQLTWHMKSHEEKFKCLHCDKRFFKEMYLINHIKSQHIKSEDNEE